MRHSIRAVVLTAALSGLVGFSQLNAADAPVAGTWKLILVQPTSETCYWIVQVEQKDGKPEMNVVTTLPQYKGTTIEKARSDDKGLHFTLKAPIGILDVDAYLPSDGKMADKLFGSLSLRGNRNFVRLERTEEKDLDVKTATTRNPAAAEYSKVAILRDESAKEPRLRELVEKHKGQMIGYAAAGQLLPIVAKAGNVGEAKDLAEQTITLAGNYGPDMKQTAVLAAAKALGQSGKVPELALEFARQAAKSVDQKTPASQEVPVLKVLASALKKAGKADEIKPIEARIVKLDEQLDKEFMKNSIPFKPESFAGRKNKSERVAVIELFTGAQCPPCVASDVAFDALLKTYKPEDVVLLQYHLHIPGPDPLTNKDAVDRAKFYAVNSTPSVFLNGTKTDPTGGPQARAKTSYNALRKIIDEQLENESKLKLTAERKGDKIDITADLADLEKTDDVRLRFVVVEDMVRYAGSNGQRLHHHVVRGFPGGVDGIEIKDKSGKQTATVTVSELSKTLEEYLTNFNKGPRPFRDDDRPLDLKHLKVVALLQDNASKEILQAVQVEIPEK